MCAWKRCDGCVLLDSCSYQLVYFLKTELAPSLRIRIEVVSELYVLCGQELSERNLYNAEEHFNTGRQEELCRVL